MAKKVINWPLIIPKNQLGVKKPVRAEPSRSMSGFLYVHSFGEHTNPVQPFDKLRANGICMA
jgi:hypothetical protein